MVYFLKRIFLFFYNTAIFFELSVALWVLTNNIYTDKIINTKRKEK